MSWLEDLEARLEQQLEQFLQTSPAQEALLADQERRDRLERLRRERLNLQGQAEQGRQALLNLAEEIRRWQERVERARAAGADDLATRAEAHGASLMDQGRQRWQALAELGQRFSAVEWELSQLERQATTTASTSAGGSTGTADTAGERDRTGGANGTLQDAWAAFEAEQELEALRQRLQR